MKSSCEFCATINLDPDGIWSPLESGINFEGEKLRVQVHHPTHELIIGFQKTPTHWNYSVEELLYLGQGNILEGVRVVEQNFMNEPVQKPVFSIRPLAAKLRGLRQ